MNGIFVFEVSTNCFYFEMNPNGMYFFGSKKALDHPEYCGLLADFCFVNKIKMSFVKTIVNEMLLSSDNEVLCDYVVLNVGNYNTQQVDLLICEKFEEVMSDEIPFYSVIKYIK